MVRCSSLILLTVSVLAPLRANAQGQGQYTYPVVWPKASGAMLVVVPVQDTSIDVYHMVGAPHLTAFDKPFPLTPQTTVNPAPADQPLIIYVPPLSVAPYPSTTEPQIDQDDFYIFVSGAPLLIEIGEDERDIFGSPDRTYLMPATSGTFR